MTVGDVALVMLVLLCAGVLFVVLPGRVLSRGSEVEVLADEKLVGTFPLEGDMRLNVSGPLGVTVVTIRNGRARIESSPCPRGICMHAGDIGAEGGVLACVPNRVIVRVVGGRSNGLDAVTR